MSEPGDLPVISIPEDEDEDADDPENLVKVEESGATAGPSFSSINPKTLFHLQSFHPSSSGTQSV